MAFLHIIQAEAPAVFVPIFKDVCIENGLGK